MTDGPYKQLMIDELARITRLESHRITQLLTDDTVDLQKTQTPIVRTPLRVATAILLQNPEIYDTSNTNINVTLLDPEQHAPLPFIMKQIEQNQSKNTAQLIEAQRNTPLFEALNKLAAWDHQVPEHQLAQEFVDIILFLSKKNNELMIQSLIDKARDSGLTEDERNTLQSLLQKRHQGTHEKISHF
jgi:DNA primase